MFNSILFAPPSTTSLARPASILPRSLAGPSSNSSISNLPTTSFGVTDIIPTERNNGNVIIVNETSGQKSEAAQLYESFGAEVEVSDEGPIVQPPDHSEVVTPRADVAQAKPEKVQILDFEHIDTGHHMEVDATLQSVDEENSTFIPQYDGDENGMDMTEDTAAPTTSRQNVPNGSNVVDVKMDNSNEVASQLSRIRAAKHKQYQEEGQKAKEELSMSDATF